MDKLIKENLYEVLDSSVNMSNQAIYWLNKNGNIVFANDNALNELGYTLEEIIKLSVWNVDAIVNTEEKYLEAVRSFDNINKNEISNTIETKHIRKNGQTFPVEVVSKFKTIGNEEYLISYVKDITRRLKRTEDINLYFELINSSSDMIFFVEHTTGLIEFVNDTACKALGYSLEQLKSMKVSDFRKPLKEMDNIALPEVFKRIQEESNLTTFGVYTTKNGKQIPVETNLQLKDYHDKSYIIAISRDITERIEVESERENLSTKLKDYNRVLQEEIQKARKELIEYEEIMKKQSKMVAMGEMLENIAHQWRQPLSAVSVLSTGMILQNEQDILNKDLLDAGLNDINHHVQYLSKTIDDFRNFFKPNKEKNSFEINRLINNSIKLSKARYDDVKIDFIIDVKDIELYTYESELLQVLLNIISNAVDELLRIDTRKLIFIDSVKDDNYFTLIIKDSAGGIDDKIIDRVFEPYFTTKHKYQGTGIGLYMSENILKHMQGSIGVENVDIEFDGHTYKGACFKIKLPL